MQTILITGGAGFIGSHFIQHLLREDTDVHIINFDKLTYAGDLRHLPDDARLMTIQGDLTDEEDLKALFSAHRFDTVVNFAAETHVDNSIRDPHIFTQVNTMGLQRLLYRAMSAEVGTFVQISTDEVYGPSRMERPFVESDALGADNPYSASKAAAELVMKAAGNTFGYPGIIIRPSNNYGTRQYPEKLIPLAIKCLVEGRPVPLYGDGNQRRDWLHVEDHVRMIHQLVEHGRPGEIYNLASGRELTNRQVIGLIIESVNRLLGTRHRFGDAVEYVEDRLGHDFSYAMSTDKVQSLLGPQKISRFEDRITEVVLFYLKMFGAI